MTTKRLAPGLYRVTLGDRSATITHIVTGDMGDGYGARDHWVVEADNGDVLDPAPTLRDAKADTQSLLSDLLAA